MHKRSRVNTGVAAAGAVALLMSGCGGSDAGADASALTLGTMTLPQSLDPAEAMGSALPFFQTVYDALVKREPDGTYVPMLATDWAYDDTLTALTLTLREDVTFDNETAIVNGLRTGQINAALLQDVDQQEVAESDEGITTLPRTSTSRGSSCSTGTGTSPPNSPATSPTHTTGFATCIPVPHPPAASPAR